MSFPSRPLSWFTASTRSPFSTRTFCPWTWLSVLLNTTFGMSTILRANKCAQDSTSPGRSELEQVSESPGDRGQKQAHVDERFLAHWHLLESGNVWAAWPFPVAG